MIDIIQNIISMLMILTVWATCMKYLFAGVKTKPKEYRYHVVYDYKKGNERGTGSLTTTTRELVDTSENMKQVGESIRDDYGYDNVVVLNIIPLKG